MATAGFTGTEAEELRRAFGFKRSEQRMAEVETEAPGRHGPPGYHRRGRRPDRHAITSFALYGFPESHASSFALLAYASAYLKVHHPAAFYAALLNNQPMGFYHAATIVKDAQRHGLTILPIDVTRSDWLCSIGEIPHNPAWACATSRGCARVRGGRSWRREASGPSPRSPISPGELGSTATS